MLIQLENANLYWKSYMAKFSSGKSSIEKFINNVVQAKKILSCTDAP